MGRKKPIWTREEREHFERTSKLLRERIEYHRAKLVEERPGWNAPKTDAEWRSYHEARIRRLAE